jgi:hypothetical protein
MYFPGGPKRGIIWFMNHTLLDHPAAAALLVFLVVGGLCSPAGATRIPVEPIWSTGCSSDITPHSPIVRVNASHQWGIVPFDVEFGIELAVDDSVLSVVWDFDGDGLADTSGTEMHWTFSDAVDQEVRAWVSTQGHGMLTASTPISGHSALMSITFDDGQMTVRTVAYSILEARGLTATAYIVPTWLNGAWYMSWNDLDFLQDHGWDIGSHTMTHPDLTKVDSTALHYELSQSRRNCRSEASLPNTSRFRTEPATGR